MADHRIVFVRENWPGVLLISTLRNYFAFLWDRFLSVGRCDAVNLPRKRLNHVYSGLTVGSEESLSQEVSQEDPQESSQERKGWHSFRMDRSTFINMHFSKVICIFWFETSPWRSSAQPETDPGTHLVCSGGHIWDVAWFSTKNDTLLRESVDWFTLNFKHCSKEEWHLTGINRNFLLHVCRFDSSDRLESWG